MKPLRLLLVVVIVFIAASALARTWTDNQENQIRAKFIRVFDGNVILQKGIKVIKVPFEDLCAEDQEYVRKQLEAKGKANLLPPKTPPDDSSTDKGDEIMLAEPGPERIWTNNQGKKIQAQLVGVKGNNAVLLYKGREVSVPLEQLSPEDQRYVEEEKYKAKRSSDPFSHATPTSPPPASPAPPAYPKGSPRIPQRVPKYIPPVQPRPPLTPPPRSIGPPPRMPISPNITSPRPQMPPMRGHTPRFTHPPSDAYVNMMGEVVPDNSQGRSASSFSANNIGLFIIGLIIGTAIGTVIGAIILRASCFLFNTFVGGKRSANAVPQPDFGQAAGISLSLVMLNYGMRFIMGLLVGSGAIAPMSGLILCIAIWFLVNVALISSVLPTSPAKAVIITTLEFVVIFCICLVFIMVVGGVGIARL